MTEGARHPETDGTSFDFLGLTHVWVHLSTLASLRALRARLEGCPVAVEVFEGNLGDPSTLANQVRKLRMRFRLKRIVLVGDRGMITQARIDADLEPAGFDWITALRAPTVQALAAEGGPLQLSLFDERDMAEIASDDYPGERLIVCRNPWRPSARASAPNSSMRPRRRWPRSARRPSESAIRSAARTRSASGQGVNRLGKAKTLTLGRFDLRASKASSEDQPQDDVAMTLAGPAHGLRRPRTAPSRWMRHWASPMTDRP